MKIIPLEQVYRRNIQIEKIAFFEQKWKEGYAFSTVMHPRGKSGIMYLSSCDLICETEGETLFAKRGDILYLPPHCRYTSTFLNVSASVSNQLLDVWLTEESEEIALSDCVIKIGECGVSENVLFESIRQTMESPISNMCLAKAQVYRFLSYISGMHKKSGLNAGQFSLIAKGIRYLEEDPLQEKSIEEIAKMCAVSSGCFRRLFSEYAGVSPSVYRIRNKMEKAKVLLESGTCTVGEVSEKLGFSDVSYFSRLFKKYMGITPKQCCI